MQKSCQKCKTPFEVSTFEKDFLLKISPKIGEKQYMIPEPQICPDCRLAERTVQRNEQNFYHNKSAISGKPLLALYAPNTPWGKEYKVYTKEEWNSDNWDGLDYGKNFDFNRPFFEQYKELNDQIPKVNMVTVSNENSPYTTGTAYCKNCHLINCSENCEDCYYGKLIQDSRDVIDSDFVYDSELLYQCFNVTKCYDCKYLSYSQNCSGCSFSDNLRGCKNCFLCTNLVNKEYHFMNKPLKKEEYEAKVKEFMSSTANIQKAKEQLKKLREQRTYKYANVVNCENSTGDFLTNCKNCTDCYDVNDSEDCKYVTVGVNVKDLVDCSNMYLKPELNYQVLGTIETYNVIFGVFVFHSQNVMYSQFCFNSQNLFGCSGLRQKKYCILNKRYSQEEYNQLVPKIIEHMQKTGEWGRFFPIESSPFGYNETVANQYLPLTKEEALKRGYKWKEPDMKEYKAQNCNVPEEIGQVKDDIIQETLACNNCSKNYKIIPQELKRLRTIGLPIPTKCPDCRQMERMSMRNPRRLYARTCDQCAAPIQTSFAPSRPETVYCEKCYLKEVY
ncbi:hypothetical protein KJ951_02335 [Patescibacteria group bacterium]|nr:hypothetical protein [Patescibacteria group bacterium]MBU1703219.1 hypothetical protein [Patescibacteria group bacterium]MBU1953750.1 hypothetical protein [Patescibacteria group bacterium]